jgi:hypothetical protein
MSPDAIKLQQLQLVDSRNEIVIGIFVTVGVPLEAILVVSWTMPLLLSRALDAGEGEVEGDLLLTLLCYRGLQSGELVL